MMLTILLAVQLFTIMVATIAVDECVRLKRRLDALEDQVSEVQDDQVAHEREHEQSRERDYTRRRLHAVDTAERSAPVFTMRPESRAAFDAECEHGRKRHESGGAS